MRRSASFAVLIGGLGLMAAPLIAASGPDFNGDGFDDIAISTVDRGEYAVNHGGEVHILYGSASGLTGQDDRIINQNTNGMADEVEPDDHFGEPVVWGDFNGDAFDDLAISVRGESVNGIDDAGAFHVLYGSADGLQTVGSQFFTQRSPGIPNSFSGFFGAAGDFNGDGFDDLFVNNFCLFFGSIGGLSGLSLQQTGEDFGFGSIVSDFNGDGFDDIATYVPLTEDLDGGVKVVYGSLMGLDMTTLEIWTEDSPGIQGEQHDYDHFGQGIAAGDFNADGYDDLVCGTYESESGPYINNEGAVHIIYGSADGLTADGSQFWHQDSPGVNDKIEKGDYFGRALTSADFDGDGVDDLAIGAYGERTGGFFKSGAVYVMYGSPDGLTTNDDQTWHQNSPGIAGTAEPRDMFGLSLANGDFNGDGRDDLVVGVLSEDIGGKIDAGSVNIIFGGSSGLKAQSNQSIHRDAPGITGQAQIRRFFGAVMTSGR
jgi:hypothetical protein